jgi:peptidoglycan/xylan/chitin deacetylase (PgdA/CDA1 family)
VTVAAGTATARIAVSVQQVPASLGLSTGTASFTSLGDTLRLVATVADAGGSPIVAAPVAWSALDTAVVSVAADGLVMASGNGTTRVFAVAGGTLASALVTVAQTADALVLSADSVGLSALGDTVSLSAMVSDAGGSPVAQPAVIWASTDTSVAKVSAAGVVTAVDNGSALVTVTADSVVGQAQVVVRQVATSLTVFPDSVVLQDPDDTTQLTLGAWDSRGIAIAMPVVSWMSAGDGIAAVDTVGRVTAVDVGTVAITATVDGVVAQTSVRVAPELTLLAAGPTVLAGQVATQLALSVRAEDLLGGGYAGATVSWTAGAGSGAITSGAASTSGPTGHAGAVWTLDTLAGAQQATASITSRGNVAQVAFTATADAGPAVSAALVADSILLSGRQERAFLGPTFRDQYGNVTAPAAVTWLSRDLGVATVAPDGLVTAIDPGATYLVGSLGASTDSLLVTVALRGAITITFDDGFVEADTLAFPLFQALGLRGNVAVNPAQVGFPDYLTKAHLDGLHAAGWSVVSHSMTHDSLSTATTGELDFELRLSQEWIQDQGYNGANVFIVPYHDWNATARAAVAQYYEAARGTSANAFVPDSLVSWKPADPYALTGIEAESLPFTSLAGRALLQDLLERTAVEGTFVDIFFHHLDPDDVDEFQATLAVIDQFRDRVLPYHELYPAFARSVF